MKKKNTKAKEKIKAESTSSSNYRRIKTDDNVEPKFFAIGFNRELCNPTGYEVCFKYDELEESKNTWWYEYDSSINKKCYGEPHKH